jgi:hypothetical protein
VADLEDAIWDTIEGYAREVRTDVLERDVEADIVKWAKKNGWLVRKFVSPGLRGVADRFFLKDGRHVFLEIKRPGKEPTEQQAKRAREIRAYGGESHWVDNLEDAIGVLRDGVAPCHL